MDTNAMDWLADILTLLAVLAALIVLLIIGGFYNYRCEYCGKIGGMKQTGKEIKIGGNDYVELRCKKCGNMSVREDPNS